MTLPHCSTKRRLKTGYLPIVGRAPSRPAYAANTGYVFKHDGHNTALTKWGHKIFRFRPPDAALARFAAAEEIVAEQRARCSELILWR